MPRFTAGKPERSAGIVALFGASLLALGSISGATASELTESTCQRVRAAAFDSGPALTPRPLTIVAVGSSSTVGTASNDKTKVYPAALQAALSRFWPKADVKVFNKGKGGETMSATIARFETDVLPLKPSLVVWQLGVNDVLRFDGVEQSRAQQPAARQVNLLLAERLALLPGEERAGVVLLGAIEAGDRRHAEAGRRRMTLCSLASFLEINLTKDWRVLPGGLSFTDSPTAFLHSTPSSTHSLPHEIHLLPSTLPAPRARVFHQRRLRPLRSDPDSHPRGSGGHRELFCAG
jgi:hypothetical protein